MNGGRRIRTGKALILARVLFCVGIALVCQLAWPSSAHAYVGPGAGFAVVSSFLTLLLASLQAFLALLTWPLRQIFRAWRRRKAYRKARTERVVIIGFDGMDPELAARYMGEGKLPNLAKLREQGTFRNLGTTIPPISPVAWSSFLTGVNPGKHNIYDFLAPDRRRYLPELSSARIRGPKRTLRIGKYAIPLSKPSIKPLRRGKPFWHYLGEAGIFASVIRVPITFPPEKFQGVLLSGMCVPDIQGTQGTFSFHTTKNAQRENASNRVVVPIETKNGFYTSYVPGPPDTLRTDAKTELRAHFQIKIPPGKREAELRFDGQRIRLPEGEYSEWVELEFNAAPGVKVSGICRFFLKSAGPDIALYATPVNINPMSPALPISHPMTYSVYLAKLHGLYATLGLAEDTWALNDGYLDDEAFLRQCYLIHDERERMFFDALEKTAKGVCVCVFDITDRVQHMFWRHFRNGEASVPVASSTDAPGGTRKESSPVIEELYQRMDVLVGKAMRNLKDNELLFVVSDHGFKSFERGVNLNTWLHQQGYLSLKEGVPSGDWFQDVDWTKTRAYALGLNGIYLNLKNREAQGTVEPGAEEERLRAELCSRLEGLRDPEDSRIAIRRTFNRSKAFQGPYSENAPDVVVGFADGFRTSWDSAQGKVTGDVFETNTKAWSGDHCIDPDLVPGVLFSNWKIGGEGHSITDVAPTMLELFGLERQPHMDGKPWPLASAEERTT